MHAPWWSMEACRVNVWRPNTTVISISMEHLYLAKLLFMYLKLIHIVFTKFALDCYFHVVTESLLREVRHNVSRKDKGSRRLFTLNLVFSDATICTVKFKLLTSALSVDIDHTRMMTSSNGNIFRITGHLCGAFTGDRWISRTKASDAELWCFLAAE